MEQNEYKMRMLHVEKLPDKATPKSIHEMIEQDKYDWREQGLTKQEVVDREAKKLLTANIATGEHYYYHAYNLLHMYRQKCR